MGKERLNDEKKRNNWVKEKENGENGKKRERRRELITGKGIVKRGNGGLKGLLGERKKKGKWKGYREHGIGSFYTAATI